MVIFPIFVLVVSLLALFSEIKYKKGGKWLLYVLFWLSLSIWAFRAILLEVFP